MCAYGSLVFCIASLHGDRCLRQYYRPLDGNHWNELSTMMNFGSRKSPATARVKTNKCSFVDDRSSDSEWQRLQPRCDKMTSIQKIHQNNSIIIFSQSPSPLVSPVLIAMHAQYSCRSPRNSLFIYTHMHLSNWSGNIITFSRSEWIYHFLWFKL